MLNYHRSFSVLCRQTVIQITANSSHPPTTLELGEKQKLLFSEITSRFKKLAYNLTLKNPFIPYLTRCIFTDSNTHSICPPSCQPAHNYKLCDTQIYLPQKNKGLNQPCLDSKSTRYCNTGCITRLQSCRLLQDGEGVSQRTEAVSQPAGPQTQPPTGLREPPPKKGTSSLRLLNAASVLEKA